ncbi:hypothetical protein EVAR_70173_1 [Eumeta japonica]|uniref:BESS domain-containing protein n=1 Tax=Eumeta variegata TaxID=151549 RepID=A0A4C1SK47_EUMVA|nr:hypothetical protein EVAR_70173_1 [Eumeta japonica]
MEVYASPHTTTTWYRPINKFDGLLNCVQTKLSVNYRPNAISVWSSSQARTPTDYLLGRWFSSLQVLEPDGRQEVQKRWANLRTCFRRELNTQKYTKSGQTAIKRRKYVYFEQLPFLFPCIENRQTESNLKEDNSQEIDEDDDEAGPSTSTPIHQQKKRVNIPKHTDLDEALLKALNETNVDEDTNFVLSLVPSLQNLTAEEKLDAKIAILNVFKQIRLARQCTSQSTCNSNMLHQPLSSFSVYHQRTNILPPQPSQAYRTSSTPSPISPQTNIQNIPSPGNSNDTAQSYFRNYSDDSEIYDL